MEEESNQTAPPQPEPDEGDMFDLAALRQLAAFVLGAALRHRRLALASFLAAGALAALSSLVLRDVYQVQAEILAQRNPVMLTLTNPGISRSSDWDAPTSAARETVLRRDNLTSLCRQTSLVDRWLKARTFLGRMRSRVSAVFTGHEPTREELTEAMVDTLENRLQAWVTPEGVVAIKVEWPDRDAAYQIVDAAVQNFLESRHAQEIAVLGETITLLEGRATKLQQDLNEALARVERKERARPRPPLRRAVTPRLSLAPQREADLVRLESTLTARRRALADLEEFRQRRLAELQAQLTQKEGIYADRHPEVLNTRNSIAAMSQPSPMIESLRLEIRDLEREIAMRGGRAAEPPRVVPELPSDLFESRSLLEPDDVRTEYERAQLRFVSDQYTSALLRSSWARLELETARAAFKYRYSVISPPTYPQGPKRPYLLLRVLGGILGGVALALFATTAADLHSGRIIEEWQISRSLGLTVLGRCRT